MTATATVPDQLRAHDPTGQVDDVLALPDHLRDALWRTESAAIDSFEASGLLVCGVGGSAIGGDLARAAIGDSVCMPMATVRGYELYPWASPAAAILCSSYSGNTEETLACYAAAEALGSRRIVATAGGELAELARADEVPVIPLPGVLQPRAAVGYMFVAAAEAAMLSGTAPGLRTEIDSSAAHLEAALGGLLELSEEIAGRLGETMPVIYGSDLTTPVAYRWKCQVNENAKRPAFSHALPELDHNEIVGWGGAREGAFSCVLLTDRDQHPRERERFELTGKLIAGGAADVIAVETEGETRTERLLWTVMLGDLVSLWIAARSGIDPAPVEVIERLKSELGRP